jgi:hypothetical protein
MRNTRGDTMRGTLTSLIVVLMFTLFPPLHASGAESIKLRHVVSVYADEQGNGFNHPEGVACFEDRMVVADTGNGRLVTYIFQGGEPRGGTEIKLPQVLYPIRAKISSKGDILVLDERQRKVVRLAREGTFKGYVEPTGLPDQGMIVPVGIDRDINDNIYLLDIPSARVLVLDAEGKFQRQVDFPKEYGFISDLTVDAKRTIFLVDSVRALVYSNTKDPGAFLPISGPMKADMKFPTNIIADTDNALYITDRNGSGILILGKDGSQRGRQLSFGWKEGLVRYPAQLCVTKDGSIVVADRENNRVQVFTPLK